MILYDELYFEITFTGVKSELKKIVRYLKSGELDEFFEIDSDYIDYDDGYMTADDSEQTSVIFSNDDNGVEIDSFDTDEFLELLCRVAKNVDVRGNFYDADDEEHSFISHEGDAYYLNAKNPGLFNDELDEHAKKEELEEED